MKLNPDIKHEGRFDINPKQRNIVGLNIMLFVRKRLNVIIYREPRFHKRK